MLLLVSDPLQHLDEPCRAGERAVMTVLAYFCEELEQGHLHGFVARLCVVGEDARIPDVATRVVVARVKDDLLGPHAEFVESVEARQVFVLVGQLGEGREFGGDHRAGDLQPVGLRGQAVLA